MSLVARPVVLLSSAAGAVAMSAAPAEAEQVTVQDRAGDASGPAPVRVSMPARRLAHAEYGDLRFIVLTEGDHGGDSDVAPAHGDQFHATRWIARG
jgi:hypothetical protein